jgi:hypothetical protein
VNFGLVEAPEKLVPPRRTLPVAENHHRRKFNNAIGIVGSVAAAGAYPSVTKFPQ